MSDGHRPGKIEMWSDIACPWGTLAAIRLQRTRARLELEGEVEIDHRAFPLELFNRRPTPRPILDAETPVAGAREPDWGWSSWTAPAESYPVTTLLALEAVQAAKEQSLKASAQLDLALRHALFAESRCISLRSEIEAVARACPSVDAGAVLEALDRGRARPTVIEQWRQAEERGVKGSPHLFLADGTQIHNPGIRWYWTKGYGKGIPVVTEDDPSIYEDLVKRAAAAS